MSKGERTFSENETFELCKGRACSEYFSISSVHRLKMLAASCRKAGKSPGRTGQALALCRFSDRSLCVVVQLQRTSSKAPGSWHMQTTHAGVHYLQLLCHLQVLVPSISASDNPMYQQQQPLWWHLVQRQGAADFSPFPSWRGCHFFFICIQEDSVWWSVLIELSQCPQEKMLSRPILLFIHI